MDDSRDEPDPVLLLTRREPGVYVCPDILVHRLHVDRGPACGQGNVIQSKGRHSLAEYTRLTHVELRATVTGHIPAFQFDSRCAHFF